MVKCVKVRKKKGQKIIEFLKKNNTFNDSRIVGRTKKYLFIPVTENVNEHKLIEKFNADIVDKDLEKSKRPCPQDLKDELRGVIPESKIKEVRRSYDVIGDIAILEIPKELKKLEKSIAWTLYRKHSNINTVAKKASKFSGKFRVRKIKPICGEEKTTTIHKESGVKLKLDLNEVYFSPRLGGERLRIARKVEPGEKVLVMFSGVAPYPLVIEKNQPEVEVVYGVELNPKAYRFARKNVMLNRSKKVIPILGDVKKVIPKFKNKFDRIIMVLPKQAHLFLEEAFQVSKKGTIIHLYQFYDEEKIPEGVKEEVKDRVKEFREVEILNVEKCGSYSPGVFRVCVDIKVL